MRIELFGMLASFLIFGGDALYHCTDNGSLTRAGFLGTYEELIQDVTI